MLLVIQLIEPAMQQNRETNVINPHYHTQSPLAVMDNYYIGR